MRSLSVLSVFALLSLVVAPGTAAAAYCTPTAPLNGLFCANELCDPAHVGTTTKDYDHRNIIACLFDESGRYVWKVMSNVTGAASGGHSYVAWGATGVCAAGYSEAYSGLAMALLEGATTASGSPGRSISNVICSTSPAVFPAHACETSTPVSCGQGWLTGGGGYAMGQAVPCKVCVK